MGYIIEGSIPEEIGDLPHLEVIYLSSNQLSGSIPSTIFNNSVLQDLDLSHNHLSGSLPSNICEGIPRLVTLYLNDNDFSGKMPSDWYQCKESEELQLSGLKGGYIPNSFQNLTNLQVLYLGYNNLQGMSFIIISPLYIIPY